jgi:hypothetical protein
MAIGDEIGDAIRNIVSILGFYSLANGANNPYLTASAFTKQPDVNSAATIQYNGNITAPGNIVTFNASRAVPTADEDRPASISAYICIKY